MIVNKDHRAGVQFQGAFDNLARVDGHMIDGAARLLFIGDERILPIEVENPEMFNVAMRHNGLAIVDQRAPARNDVPFHHPRAGEALGRGFDDL